MIGLDEVTLGQAFPFFLALRADDRTIAGFGPSVRRLAPCIEVGESVEGVVAILRPSHADWSRCGVRASELWWMRLCDRLALRGQWVRSGGYLLFLGAPIVQDLQDLERSGLSMIDFAPHDGTVDSLFLIQARDAALADATELTQRLQQHRDRLAMTNVALRASRDEVANAMRASAEKTSFLAGMSHELRTPLNAIIGYTEILLEEADEDRAHPLLARHGAGPPEGDLHRILHAADQLLSLINDVLDVARVESGRLDLHPEFIDGRELLQAVDDLVRPLAVRQHTRLVWSIGSGVGEGRLDTQRVRQILINLVSNAIRATEGGTVRTTLDQQDREWVIAVEDDGCGMGGDLLERLFQPFIQGVGGTTAQRSGGTGLGLTIARLLARRMGGDITVSSEVGVGSTFTLRIPCDVADLLTPVLPMRNGAGGA